MTLVLFSDFECVDCGRASPMARMVENLFGDEVRLVFRQLPGSTHAQARLATEASLEAEAQGKFWSYHDVLFGNPQDLGRPALERYAGLAGLDLPRFRAALDERRHAAEVDEDVELARAVFAGGTPSLYVNRRRATPPSTPPRSPRRSAQAARVPPNDSAISMGGGVGHVELVSLAIR